MGYYLTILYYKNPSSKFDTDYYTKSHMPFAYNAWKDNGCTGYVAKQMEPGPDGSEPKFIITCDMFFNSREGLVKSMGVQKVMEDIPNFTNETPIFLISSGIGSGP
jgi:uncharacterized protein (TIGR02118 family)